MKRLRFSAPRLRIFLGRMVRSLWFRPAVSALAAPAAIGLTILTENWFSGWFQGLGDELVSVDEMIELLSMIGSSLLAVAIFSLGTMNSAMQAAASSATPRVRPLLGEDGAAQSAISTFLGAFIFCVIGITGLALDFFDDAERLALLAMTLLLVIAVVVALVTWINRLTTIGGPREAIALLVQAGQRSLEADLRRPCLGAAPLAKSAPAEGQPIRSTIAGFIEHVEVAALSRIAERLGAEIVVTAVPGMAVHPGVELGRILGPEQEEAILAEAREAFVIGPVRSYEADPLLALLALSEIASRALSPAVNDPGTATEVIVAQTVLLTDWRRKAGEIEAEEPYPGVRAPALGPEPILREAFNAIARDGATMIEVQERLHGALAALADTDRDFFSEAARKASAAAVIRAEHAGLAEEDATRIAALRRKLGLTE